MSINKILCLVGSILYSFVPIVFLVIGVTTSSNSAVMESFVTSINNSAAQSGAKSFTTAEIANLFLGFFVVLAVMTLIVTLFNWLAFAKIDGAGGRKWRIYLLVMGILTIIFGFTLGAFLYFTPIITGVLFILAFALNRDKLTNEEN